MAKNEVRFRYRQKEKASVEKHNTRLIIQATPQEELLMVLSDFSWICWSEQLARVDENTLQIEKPYQKSKKTERAINPEIGSHHWLNVQKKCKINFCIKKLINYLLKNS